MALLYPTLAHIQKSKYKPEDGETHLLTFLENNLSDEYEIYFQPFLNGDRPDVVLMRRGSGVLVIEVKDWHLPSYFIDENDNWRIGANGARTKSPLAQVKAYKRQPL